MAPNFRVFIGETVVFRGLFSSDISDVTREH